MKAQTILRTSLIALAVSTLPGCLAINMLLGAGSMLVGGPVQYASAAYTVGEYSYQYAVNDKNPGEVIEDKIAWLLPEEPEAAPVQLAAADVPDVPISSLPVKGLKLPPMRSPESAAHPLQLASARLRPRVPEQRVRPDKKAPATVETVAEARVTEHVPEKTPVRTPAQVSPETPVRKAQPAVSLARRLQDSQRRFRTMDRLMVASEGSTRIRVPAESRGINGAWQVRHRIDEQPYS